MSLRRILNPIFATIILLVLGHSSVPAETGVGRMRLEQFLLELTSLDARFEQKLIDEYGELLEESTGIVAIAKPGKFRWEYLDPYLQLIVSDGQTLWIYDADLEQVSINPFEQNTTGSPAELLVGDVDLDRHYLVVETEGSDELVWVLLTPRDDAAQYNAIEIGFDEAGLRGMKLKDNLNQQTIIRFDDVVRNAAIDEGRFNFTPPPGVDVMSGGSN